MYGRKIKVSKHYRKRKASELYQAKCQEAESWKRKYEAQISTIKLLVKCLDDATERRNKLEAIVAMYEQRERKL